MDNQQKTNDPIEEKTKGGLASDLDELKPVGNYEYTVKYNGISMRIWACLLISVITALISILTTRTINNDRSSTVYIIFVSILIIMFTVYFYGFWGVLTAAISSLLFCITIKTSLLGIVFNISANVLQALVIWFVFKFTRLAEKVVDKKGIVNDYKFLMVVLGGLYIIFSFNFEHHLILYIFSGLLLLVDLIFSIINKSATKILFFLLLCVLPSFAGAILNSAYMTTGGAFRWSALYDSFALWFFSNSILFGTFGYIFVSAVGSSNNYTENWKKKAGGGLRDIDKEIKFSTILYYVATLIWNILFYIMYIVGWLESNTSLYLFPWAVGNLFFLLNLLFTKRKEIKAASVSIKDAFNWFEQRAVVVERNTQMLITVIAFLLPLSASYLGTITAAVSIIFVLNITTAVISIGLIWVPQNNVHTMEIIKNVKTIFHLFTLSLLLLNAIMIIPI
ncbi:MAG: hypothetical protein J1F71_02130 [Clostridiales bacterium]|nr:hypothetical protein [Clostridiales bacterium]